MEELNRAAMDTEYNDAMNVYDARKGIRAENYQPVPQESGKETTSLKEGGETSGKEGKL